MIRKGPEEVIQFNYMLGSRTLVKSIQRMPWHATLTGEGTLERHPPIRHGTRFVKAEEAAVAFREYLSEELHDVAQDRDQIVLLLSGGLDSRIVAGILKRLEPHLPGRIRCATWGQDQSRDVVYARRISSTV